jgi:putative hemolysin/dipeptidyl aminopeptidase/acylaminoacyl peptidase
MAKPKIIVRYFLGVLFPLALLLSLAGCKTPPETLPTPTGSPGVSIANPASENCLAQGGTLIFETREDGGQYGVCLFDDNRQCEEWALLNGDCPVGGLKVTGYITPAARFCAITGGTYAITANGSRETEQGTCTFKNGVVCDVWDYYRGLCSPSQPASSDTATPAQPATAIPAESPTAAPAQPVIPQLVFDSTRGSGYRDLYVMDMDGANVTRVTPGEGDSFAGPWSPDGTRIVFTGFGPFNSFIASIRADGSDLVVLSSVPDSDEGFPDWSPDGQQIVFTSRRDGNNEIYVMDAAGTNPVRLTDSAGDDFAPRWSPDGTQIVFVSDRDQTPGVYDLYRMNADGSNILRLTNDTAIDYAPDWSPDGARIAYRTHENGPADIYVMNVDGTGRVNLSNNPAEDWAPSWSPDGSLILFQTNRDGNWEIYQMAADGSQQINLTNNPADDQLPFWRPMVQN